MMNIKSFLFRGVAVAWFAAAVCCVSYIFMASARPLASETYSGHSDDNCVLGNDFQLRMNEIECLRLGVDPYLVWHEEVQLGKYYPFGSPDKKTSEHVNPINAYTPWEYTFLMPLQMLGADAAWWVYLAIMAVACLSVCLMSFSFGVSRAGFFGGCLVAAAALSPVLGIWSDVRSGNFALTIAAAGFVMLWLLEHDHEYLAGVALSFMMVKPQLSILLVIPLLFLRKIRTASCGH